MSEYQINICPKDNICPVYRFNVMFFDEVTLNHLRHKTRDVHVLNSPANVNVLNEV